MSSPASLNLALHQHQLLDKPLLSPRDTSSPSSDGDMHHLHQHQQQQQLHNHAAANKKRSGSSAQLDTNGNPKPVKRRAAKACTACRARKVRCDVMQRYHFGADGDPTCSNCTMDGIKCVVQESKRRKKHLNQLQIPAPQAPHLTEDQAWQNGLVDPANISNPEARRWSDASSNEEFAHIPHSIYQQANPKLHESLLHQHNYALPTPIEGSDATTYALLTSASIAGDRKATRIATPTPHLKHELPVFLKPLPPRMTSVDIDYLFAKGALSIPQETVRDALLRSYVEFVHPYMPLLELEEVLRIVRDIQILKTNKEGVREEKKKLSLLLFQAIMFAGTAFVDMKYLQMAGFSNRKVARKAFFQKARVLYDFDYEIDRIALVQSLLLMTYWYETPDDQKDTWHWMGVAISLAHTIGLHRDPAKAAMSESKKKLWKRIWWSCFMRDRLIALGMRRPTRVKDEDYDVPMLEVGDFETKALQPNLLAGCRLISDKNAQEELALMCIAKARLCLCVSHVLGAQYSVLIKHQGQQGNEGPTRSSVMLFPKKLDQTDEVRGCDDELSQWVADLPAACEYSDKVGDHPTVHVQRALLHMVYYTTLSALHRPQVLPSGSTTVDSTRELADLSKKKVREASYHITLISRTLHVLDLDRYLPTTGVTVLLPAIIIQLLDIKASNDSQRLAATESFRNCMSVLERLRDNYASADFAIQFLEAAIQKAGVDLVVASPSAQREVAATERIKAGIERLSPPVDEAHPAASQQQPIPDTTMERDMNAVAASMGAVVEEEVDLDDFVNFDGPDGGWNVPFEEGAHGESGGFLGDMGWIQQPAWSPSNDVDGL